MSRSVTFNGITQFRPGGITKVDASALAQIGLSSNGIVGLIGEAEGGEEPGEIITIDDPALAKSSFRGDALANAIKIAFDPSDDPRVPSGAFRTLNIRVNQGVRASLPLYNKVGEAVTVAGSTKTSIVFAGASFTVDEHVGNLARIGTYADGAWSGVEDVEIESNTTDTLTLVSPGFNAAPGTTVTVTFLAPVVTLWSKEYSAAANGIQQEYEPGASSGQAWTTSFEGKSQISDDLGGKSFLDIEYIGQKTAVVQDSGLATAGTTVTITDSTKTWGVNDWQGFFAYADDAGVLAVDNLRKIASNTSDEITVTAAFTGTPDTSTNYEVRTGMIYESTTGFSADGLGSVVTLQADLDIALNELAGLVLVVTSGDAAGTMRAIASNTAAAGPVVTLDEAWLAGAVPAGPSLGRPYGDSYELRYVTAATASIAGTDGVAKTFTTSIAVNGAAAAADLDITFDANQTLAEFVNEINGYSDYRAYVPNGVNGATTLMKTFDFDVGATEVDIRNDRAAVEDPPNAAYDVPVVWKGHFRRDLQVFVDDINGKNTFITAVRAAGASTGAGGGRPEFTDGSVGIAGDTFKYFSGGTRGISTNSNWQAAFDKLLQVRCNHVVPLISEDLANQGYGSTATFASVAAQLAVHVSLGSGAAKNECGGYIGMKGNKNAIVLKANSLNNTDVALTCQRHTLLDVSGNLTEFDEWVSAVIAAGMRSGVSEVGEPLTWKYFRTTGMSQDSSWDPGEKTDANLFIQNGILFAETIRGKGTRWVRDLTTYVQDDNLAYAEGSVRDIVRYVSFGLRTFLEDRFTGRKARPATASSIKESIASYLELLRGENIIVDSEDNDGNPVYAFHNIRVSISGDIARIKLECFPAVGINFQLTEIFLQLPQSSA